MAIRFPDALSSVWLLPNRKLTQIDAIPAVFSLGIPIASVAVVSVRIGAQLAIRLKWMESYFPLSGKI